MSTIAFERPERADSPLAGIASSVAAWRAAWKRSRDHARIRAKLKDLDRHLLRDIGFLEDGAGRLHHNQWGMMINPSERGGWTMP